MALLASSVTAVLFLDPSLFMFLACVLAYSLLHVSCHPSKVNLHLGACGGKSKETVKLRILDWGKPTYCCQSISGGMLKENRTLSDMRLFPNINSICRFSILQKVSFDHTP